MEHTSLLGAEAPKPSGYRLEMKGKSFGTSLFDTPCNIVSKDAGQFEIDQEILRKADKCKRGLACLFGDDLDGLHDVEDVMGRVLHFVKCTDNSCPYLASYGFLGNACSCPVRIEIYRKYGR